jgi:hypothetical protein
MKEYIEVPLIYNYSDVSKNDIKGIANLYLKSSKSKNIGSFACHSCNYKDDLFLYKQNNILFDNSLIHHMVTHNYKPEKETMDKISKNTKSKNYPKIKIKATYIKSSKEKKFILSRNQILILDSLMNYGKEKLYGDKKKDYRYSEHAGLLDFNNNGLEKVLVSAETNRQDKDDPEILLPQNMQDALDYEFMFHTHPPTPYAGARASVGVLYEFPSISDIFHFIEHYNIGETQGSLIIAPEGIYIIHSVTGNDKIKINDENKVYKELVNESFEIQRNAIEKYGKDFKDNNKFYTDVIPDKTYIYEFNKLLKKYLDGQIYVEYLPRNKDKNGNYVVDKIVIELKPIEAKV